VSWSRYTYNQNFEWFLVESQSSHIMPHSNCSCDRCTNGLRHDSNMKTHRVSKGMGLWLVLQVIYAVIGNQYYMR